MAHRRDDHARRAAFNEQFHAAIADLVRDWHGYTVNPVGMTRLLATVPLHGDAVVPALEAEDARLARLGPIVDRIVADPRR